MKEKYTFYKNVDLDEEINLGAVMGYVFGKWRSILIFCIVGALLGAPLGYFIAEKNVLHVEDLSESIMSQLDNYAGHKVLDEKLNEDDRELYIMSLNPDETYYQSVLKYTVRTDNHEDIELVAKYLDITDDTDYLYALAEITGYEGYLNNLDGLLEYEYEISEAFDSNGANYIGGYSDFDTSGTINPAKDEVEAEFDADLTDGGTLDEETVAKIEDAVAEIAENGDATELEELISSLNKGQTYAYLTYTSKYLNEEQLTAFVEWLMSNIERLAEENCGTYSGFNIKFVKDSKLPLRATDIYTAQQTINDRISDRATAVDVDVEILLAGYATTIPATNSDKGKPAIIKTEDKEKYQMYWESITNPEFINKVSKVTIIKWIVIFIVLFGIIGIICLFIKYFKFGKTIDEKALRDDYHLPILGLVDEGRTPVRGLDKIFARKLSGMEISSYDYISDSVAKSSADPIVIIKTKNERGVSAFVEQLRLKTGKTVVCGDIASESKVLDSAINAGVVYIVVELGKTQTSSLEANLHLIEHYGLQLGGIIMI